MRARHHDAGIHARYAPQGETARRLFDAMETARIEALAGRQMPGVGDNLDAVLSEDAARLGWAGSEGVDLVEAARLFVRARGSGRPLPEAAALALEGWREQLEGQTAAQLDRLDGCLEDQETFAKLAWAMIDDMGYGEQLGETPDSVEQQDDGQDESADQDSDQAPEQDQQSGDEEGNDGDQPDQPESESEDQSYAAESRSKWAKTAPTRTTRLTRSKARRRPPARNLRQTARPTRNTACSAA